MHSMHLFIFGVCVCNNIMFSKPEFIHMHAQCADFEDFIPQ